MKRRSTIYFVRRFFCSEKSELFAIAFANAKYGDSLVWQPHVCPKALYQVFVAQISRTHLYLKILLFALDMKADLRKITTFMLKRVQNFYAKQ